MECFADQAKVVSIDDQWCAAKYEEGGTLFGIVMLYDQNPVVHTLELKFFYLLLKNAITMGANSKLNQKEKSY
jgi:hypothetical protein